MYIAALNIPIELVNSAALVLVSLIGAVIARRLKTPTDYERAQLLARIATDAAHLVTSMYPRSAWKDLLEATVKAIASAAGVPTNNMPAIQRAAVSALVSIGKSPNG